MKIIAPSSPPATLSLALSLTIGLGVLAPLARAAEAAGEFSKPIMDLGMVVKDSDRTARFLTNAIGFEEVKGFPVTAEQGKKIGLIDSHATTVRVFVLEEVDPATRLKVLSFPESPGKPADQAYIHS